MDSSFLEYAYEDKPFPIGSGQTISQPYTVAFQTELLNCKPGQKVLEIGTGSGYQSAILFAMGAKVYSIERQLKLYQRTLRLFARTGIKVQLLLGDGYQGIPEQAPFDGILVTAAAPALPDQLLEQLKPGGCLVCPVGNHDAQTMMRIYKNKEGEISSEKHGSFRFVPLLPKIAND